MWMFGSVVIMVDLKPKDDYLVMIVVSAMAWLYKINYNIIFPKKYGFKIYYVAFMLL